MSSWNTPFPFQAEVKSQLDKDRQEAKKESKSSFWTTIAIGFGILALFGVFRLTSWVFFSSPLPSGQDSMDALGIVFLISLGYRATASNGNDIRDSRSIRQEIYLKRIADSQESILREIRDVKDLMEEPRATYEPSGITLGLKRLDNLERELQSQR